MLHQRFGQWYMILLMYDSLNSMCFRTGWQLTALHPNFTGEIMWPLPAWIFAKVSSPMDVEDHGRITDVVQTELEKQELPWVENTSWRWYSSWILLGGSWTSRRVKGMVTHFQGQHLSCHKQARTSMPSACASKPLGTLWAAWGMSVSRDTTPSWQLGFKSAAWHPSPRVRMHESPLQPVSSLVPSPLGLGFDTEQPQNASLVHDRSETEQRAWDFISKLFSPLHLIPS